MSSTRLNPYLNFRGQAREVVTFYESVFGGQLEVMTFADSGGMGVPEEEADQVMHSMLTVSDSVAIMVSDVPSTMPDDLQPSGVIALSGDDATTLRRWWDGLLAGGVVHVPLEKAPWGDSFGQLADKFGVTWMFNVGDSGDGQGS